MGGDDIEDPEGIDFFLTFNSSDSFMKDTEGVGREWLPQTRPCSEFTRHKPISNRTRKWLITWTIVMVVTGLISGAVAMSQRYGSSAAKQEEDPERLIPVEASDHETAVDGGEDLLHGQVITNPSQR